MSSSDNENTPTPILKEPVISSTDSSDPKTITEKYTVIDRIGQGGMGRVYTAHDARLDRTVAIKVLLGTDHNSDYLRRFQLEAKAASKLKHSGIVQVYDFGLFDDNKPFLVMEYVKGKTLAQFIDEQGALPAKIALPILIQLCRALHHAHSQKVLHRDLKPSNIIVNQDDRSIVSAFILDFGIAKLVEDGVTNETITKTGQIIGSPRCMSPEQAGGLVLDARSDVYSLACIAYELLVGKPPYAGNTALATINMHISDPVPEIGGADNAPGHPDDLVSAIAKGMAKEPNNRFESMAEFAEVLQQILEEIEQRESSQTIFERDNSFDSGLDKPLIDISAPSAAAAGSDTELSPANRSPRKFMSLAIAFSLLAIFVASVYLFVTTKSAEENTRLYHEDAVYKNKLTTQDNLNGDEDFERAFKQAKVDAFKKYGYDGDRTIYLHGDSGVKALTSKYFDKDKYEVAFVNDTTFDDSLAEQFTAYRGIFKFRLNRCKTTQTGIAKLADFKRLYNLQFFQTKLSKAELREILKLKNLKVMKFLGDILDDSDLKVLAQSKSVQVIRFVRNDFITEKGLSYFKGNSHWKIAVSDCRNITSKQIKQLNDKYEVNFVEESLDSPARSF